MCSALNGTCLYDRKERLPESIEKGNIFCSRIISLPQKMSLFPQVHPDGRRPLVQFRAGRMKKEGKLVTPEKKQGMLSMYRDASGMVELQWSAEGIEPETCMIFPGDATVQRVAKCTTGRVFVIDFKGTRQLFYWLQERSEERDADYLKLLKKNIEGDAASSSSNTSTSTSAASASTNSNNIQLSQLQSILGNLGALPAAGAPAAAVPATQEIDLQKLLASPEMLAALREDPAFYMNCVHESLPEGSDSSSDVAEQVRNPQASAGAALLQAALQTPEGFRELCTAFGISQRPGRTPITALEFLECIIEDAEKKKKEKPEE